MNDDENLRARVTAQRQLLEAVDKLREFHKRCGDAAYLLVGDYDAEAIALAEVAIQVVAVIDNFEEILNDRA